MTPWHRGFGVGCRQDNSEGQSRMCRGIEQCTELADRETWSKRTPLPPPTIARDHMLRLAPLIDAVAAGQSVEGQTAGAFQDSQCHLNAS